MAGQQGAGDAWLRPAGQQGGRLRWRGRAAGVRGGTGTRRLQWQCAEGLWRADHHQARRGLSVGLRLNSKRYVKEGDIVTAGQPIAEIDRKSTRLNSSH